MKKHYLFCIIAFLFITITSKSQWNPCMGIEGGNVNDLIHHDTSIYIANSGGGVFKKGVHEQAWGENVRSGSFFKIRGTDYGLFCLGYYNFYRSLDNGLTWDEPELDDLVVDLETSDSVVFIVTDYEVLRSFDQGNTWEDINPFPAIQASEQNLCANDSWIICAINSGDSISYSNDYGESWKYIPLFDSAGYISDVFIFENILWLAYRNKGEYSYDKISGFNIGVNAWFPLNDSIPSGTDVTTFFIRDSILGCGTENGIYHLDPQDLIWKSDNNNGLESKNIKAVCIISDSMWVATSHGPFFKTGNSDWLPDYQNLYQREVTQVFKKGYRVYALSGDKIYYSDNIEDGFGVMNTDGLGTAYEILITDSAWYAASTEGFLISIDSGLTWISHSSGPVSDLAVTSGYYYYANGGVFRTRIDSIAWERVPNDLAYANVWEISSLNNIVFASVYMEGLYRSEDNGTTFQHVPESGTDIPIIHVEEQTLFMMKDFEAVLSTSGDCTQWENYISGFLDYTMLVCMDVCDSGNSTILGGGKIYIGLYDYFLEYYENPPNGDGIDIRDNLPYCSYPFINSVYNDNGRLFACPNANGLYYRDDFIVNVKEPNAAQVIDNRAIKIYPNPASEKIFINSSIKNEVIGVKIFNSQGLLVQSGTLTDGSIDVSNFRKGIYIIELNTGNRYIRKKIIII